MTPERDKKLSELAEFIEDELFEIYGEEMAFMLNVTHYDDSEAEDLSTHYISNIDRETSTKWLRQTIQNFEEEIIANVAGTDTLQ